MNHSWVKSQKDYGFATTYNCSRCGIEKDVMEGVTDYYAQIDVYLGSREPNCNEIIMESILE